MIGILPARRAWVAWAMPRWLHLLQGPGFALKGDEGEARDVVLELKSVADVALVGFPSAGKSSLIAAMSAARPKIADYPFTTLVPNLGVVQAWLDERHRPRTPGLIPGASEGKGLGLEFLRHIERCAGSYTCWTAPLWSPGAIRSSITNSSSRSWPPTRIRFSGWRTASLMERPRLAVLNKIDVPEARELAEFVREELEERGLRVFEISAVSREGLRPLPPSRWRRRWLRRANRAAAGRDPPHVLRPRGRDEAAFTIARRSRGGEDFLSLCVAKSLSAGCARRTSTTTRPWATLPTVSTTSALRRSFCEPVPRLATWWSLDRRIPASSSTGSPPRARAPGPRGTDLRVDENTRPSRKQRRDAYMDRMDAKEEARQELWMEREAGHWTDPSAE